MARAATRPKRTSRARLGVVKPAYMAEPTVRASAASPSRDELLRAAEASPEIAGRHDKSAWLALYSDDAVLEDPVGTPASRKGHRPGRLGDELGRFYEAFIAPSDIEDGLAQGPRVRDERLPRGRYPHDQSKDGPPDHRACKSALRDRTARRRVRDSSDAGTLGSEPDWPPADGAAGARSANDGRDELEHASRIRRGVGCSVRAGHSAERRTRRT